MVEGNIVPSAGRFELLANRCCVSAFLISPSGLSPRFRMNRNPPLGREISRMIGENIADLQVRKTWFQGQSVPT
jgi:hypothetical protein